MPESQGLNSTEIKGITGEGKDGIGEIRRSWGTIVLLDKATPVVRTSNLKDLVAMRKVLEGHSRVVCGGNTDDGGIADFDDRYG